MKPDLLWGRAELRRDSNAHVRPVVCSAISNLTARTARNRGRPVLEARLLVSCGHARGVKRNQLLGEDSPRLDPLHRPREARQFNGQRAGKDVCGIPRGSRTNCVSAEGAANTLVQPFEESLRSPAGGCCKIFPALARLRAGHSWISRGGLLPVGALRRPRLPSPRVWVFAQESAARRAMS